MRIRITAEHGRTATSLLVAADDSTPAEVAAGLVCAAAGAPVDARFVPPGRPGAVPAESDGTLATAGWRHGMRVRLDGDAAPPDPRAQDGLELHVVGGPSSGLVFALPAGETVIGRSGPIAWPDHLLSRRHAVLQVAPEGVTIEDLGSSNGTFVDGVQVEAPTAVGPDAMVRIGETLLQVRSAKHPDAAIEPDEPGWLNFLRPPRVTARREPAAVDVPVAPKQPHRRRFPIAAIIAPLIMGAVMVLLTRSMMFAAMMLLSPMMIIFNAISDRRAGVTDYRTAVAEYEEALAAAQQELDTAIASEQAWLRNRWPDAAATFLTCVLPGRRLWERRRLDDDAFELRLGTADLPSTVKVTGGDDGRGHELVDVPVQVGLRSHPVLGIAGPEAAADALLRWVVMQLAAYHAPRDLSASFIGADVAGWEWLEWLPQFAGGDSPGAPLAYVAGDDEAVTGHVAGLTAMIQSRQDLAKEDRQVTALAFPVHVLVIHGYRSLRATPGLGTILSEGPAVGVYTVCCDREERLLAEECSATLVIGEHEPSRATLRRAGLPTIEALLVEGVTAAWCELAGREIACLRDVGAEDDGSVIPTSSRLLEVLELEPVTPERIQAGWLRVGRSTEAVIGEGMDGDFTVDLRRDGPHGLVAGTTGSGKSELLQTLIASLSCVNRPDELNFVLIDYKGGAAFKDCGKLPHTVGMVTDLDGHLTNRALASLGAELRRREHQLAGAGAKDIEDYLVGRREQDAPMPRLLIVIDEFAALVQELPEFVAGLIDIARRGRSLGVHLILATQRPAGVVNAEIKSNTNLRIALRVTDTSDSTDVIDAPDAARIPKSIPGRAYARLGHSSLVAFQSSRVGGHPPGAEGPREPLVWAYAPADLPRVPPAQPNNDDDATTPTDLATLVTAIQGAATEARIATPSSPWLPALEPVVTLDQLVADFPQATPGGDRLAIPFGLTDMPARQARGVAALDLARGGNLAVVGGTRTGRSTALRTLAAGVGRWLSPADVQLYGVDCGSNVLLPLTRLPHVGAVVTREQNDRMGRLTVLLRRLIAQRQQQLAADGYADLAEQRANTPPEQRLPYTVILFDAWEQFVQAYDNLDGGQLVTAWQQILQEGPGAGLRVVMTGDRTLLTGRMSALFPDKLLLKLPDPSDYSVIGMSAKSVPSAMPPGRGFRAESLDETQVALIAADPAGTAQVAAFHQIATRATEAWPLTPDQPRPPRVDILPVRISETEAAKLLHDPWRPTEIPIAVGGDTLAPYPLDAIEHGPGLLITGPRRSGRSTVLETMARYALAHGWQVAAVTPRASPLRALTGAGFLGAFDTDSDRNELEDLLAGLRSGPAPSLTLVDDIEILGADGWLPDALAEHLTKLRDSGSILAGAGSPADMAGLYRGPIVALKRARSGVMLSPQSSQDFDMFGVSLPRSVLAATLPPGAGYLIRSGQATRVQVICPD